jgi:hypothetical protein
LVLRMMVEEEPFDIEAEINILKKKLSLVWETKGQIDQEVLDLSKEIDHLLNLYYCQGSGGGGSDPERPAKV